MRTGSFGSHEAYLQIPLPRPFANPRDELPPVHILSCKQAPWSVKDKANIFARRPQAASATAEYD